MDALTKLDILSTLKIAPDDALFCPDCLSQLKRQTANVFRCNNKYCANRMKFDKQGNWKKQ